MASEKFLTKKLMRIVKNHILYPEMPPKNLVLFYWSAYLMREVLIVCFGCRGYVCVA